VNLVKTYDNGWVYPLELAKFSVEQQLLLGITANGDDQTVGNFDLERVQGLLDILEPIFKAQKQPWPEGIRPDQVVTNEFIDPRIGIRSPTQ
jgi:hypothetical protein